MSDYLWDKTGEPDAEVERLEKLLGTLAHQPRSPELPAATRSVHAPRRRSTRPALAAAAALALMLLAGVWLVATRRPAKDVQTAQQARTPATRTEERARDDNKQETATHGDKNTAVARSTGATGVTTGRESGGRSSHQQSARASRSARSPRAAVHANAGSGKKNRGGGAREGAREEELVASAAERQQEAKEQLVYALRLTGAKLSEVQTKVRGASDARPAPDERNRIR